MSDLVSVLLATIPERRFFLPQAIKYFLGQTYHDKELVVISDGGELDKDELPEDPRITYVVLKDRHPLGTKLNIGVEYTKGPFLLKMDDDDWYHPDFMSAAIHSLLEQDFENGITRFRRAPMLLLKPWQLRAIGYYDAKVGNAMCFNRKMWEKTPFQDIPRRVDTMFWKDHPEHTDVIIKDPDLVCMVRHGIGHLWTEYLEGYSVEDFFGGSRPEYETAIEKFFPSEDLEFYRRIREEILKNDAQVGHNTVRL